jgi:hypothetical protein
LRLNPRFRFAIYAAFCLLFVTGAAWLLADQFKESSDGEAWQFAGAYLLMLHGGGAMITLMLLGALVPLHVRHGWRGRRNRLAGAAMLACNGLLIFSSFGLYYAGSEALRPWLSSVHTALGLGLPIIWCLHVIAGRYGRAASQNHG